MAKEYYFLCPGCKFYAVTDETFKELTTGDLWDRVEEALSQGADFGVIEFDERCPLCVINRERVLTCTTKVFWPKENR
jgi:hypothetical protein